MAEVGSAFVSLIPSAKGFGRKMESEVGGDVKGAGKRLGGSFGKMFALAGGVLAAAGIGSFLKDSLGEAREAQKVGALTESIIKSTGGAAKVTAGQVGDLASAISLKTGIDDEAIQSGSNLLLTFKNVRNEAGKGSKIFDRATQSAVDLSAAGFGSVESGSKMLGKALNDPIKGISALGRAGVTFTEGQKEQIKTLVESGDTLKAQKIILGEVESQVGGAAEATATYGDKAAVAFGNIKEQVGTQLLIPAVDALSRAFLGLVPSISKGIGNLAPIFRKITDAVTPVVASLRDTLQPAVEQLFGFFRKNPQVLAVIGGALLAMVSPIAAVAVGFGILYAKSETVREFVAKLVSGLQEIGTKATPVVGSLIAAIKANLVPALQTAANTFSTVILPAVSAVVSYVTSSLVPVFQQVAGIITARVLPILSSLATFFYGTLYPAIVGIVAAVAQNLKPVFDQLVVTFQAKVLPAVSRLLATFQKYQPTIQRVIGVVVKVVGKVLEFAAAILGKVLPVAIRFAGFLIGNLANALIKIVGGVAKVIGKLINFGSAVGDAVRDVIRFQQSVSERVAKVVTYFVNLPGRIIGALSGLGTKMYNAGVELMRMLAKGITDKAKAAIDALKNVAGKLKDLVPGSPVKEGPLTSFNGGHAGEELMLMFGRGIEKGGEKAVKAAEEVAKKVRDRMAKNLDDLQSKLKGFKDTFAGVVSSISDSFKGNLFEATTGADFISNLFGKRAELTALKSAFKKLLGWGLSPGFLGQLFQSGNAGLILDLAAGDKATAMQGQSLFNDVGTLSNQLGTSVASLDAKLVKGIADTTKEIRELRNDIRHLAKDTGYAVGSIINQAASKGKRSQPKGGRAT